MECYAMHSRLWRAVIYCGTLQPFPLFFLFLILHLIWFSMPVWFNIQTFTTLSRVTGTLRELKVYKVSMYLFSPQHDVI